MNMNTITLYFFIVILLHAAKAAMPGTFFWRPRVTIDLDEPITENPSSAKLSVEIRNGLIVMIDGYSMTVSLLALTTGIAKAGRFAHHNPFRAAYYNDVYRWTLRYLYRIPKWIALKSGHYINSQKVYKNRYEHMDEFVPKWLRPLLFFVKDSDWKKEEEHHRRYKKYAEHAFAPFYIYHYNSKMKPISLKTLSESAYSFPQAG